MWATLATGCNPIFGIHEGTPRPICADELMIDDMEDGDRFICRSGGRSGVWFDFGDGSSTGDLTPSPNADFTPTRIEDGTRGTSRYAAHFTGSGFTGFGAFMGFDLLSPPDMYDLGGLGGITFWMKSNTPVSVDFPTSETIPTEQRGQCVANASANNCNDHFTFPITAPAPGWAEYKVPFNAVAGGGGSATWNPRHLWGVNFRVPAGAAFDVWVDDIAFYTCAGPECEPTCTDPLFPVPCRALGGPHSSCQPPGTVCASVGSRCADPLLIDDMEDGDSAICHSGGRYGSWFTYDDGTGTTLTPRADRPFLQTAIPGGRAGSLYAAHLAGSGYTAWGAGMGFDLNAYDASPASGIRFWMKSADPVSVQLPIPETTPPSELAGACRDDATQKNCTNHFEFDVSSTGNEWAERSVPFAALRQRTSFHGNGNLIPGSARWDPSHLLGVNFGASQSEFDFWIDDVRFYTCERDRCLPTCSADAVACPASAGRPADCWPSGTDCSRLPERLVHTAVWGSGPTEAWTVGFAADTLAGTLLRWDGSAWSPSTNDATPPLFGAWGSGADDVWAVGDKGTLLRWSGSAWLSIPSATTSTFNGVWGSDANDVWAIESPGTMRHWDGSVWSSGMGVAPHLAAVWGASSDDAWAVGISGTILHWEGRTWSTTSTGSRPLNAVWGAGPRDVWAVGGAGTAIHWDGSTWLPFPSGTTLSLFGLWGSGPDDVWAVGENGTIVRWDGSAWHSVPSGTIDRLNAVWGSGSRDAWAVGFSSTILHWNGDVWSPSPSPQ